MSPGAADQALARFDAVLAAEQELLRAGIDVATQREAIVALTAHWPDALLEQDRAASAMWLAAEWTQLSGQQHALLAHAAIHEAFDGPRSSPASKKVATFLAALFGVPGPGSAFAQHFAGAVRLRLQKTPWWRGPTVVTAARFTQLGAATGADLVTLSAGPVEASLYDCRFERQVKEVRQRTQTVDNARAQGQQAARLNELAGLLRTLEAERRELVADLPPRVGDDDAVVDRVTGMAIGRNTGPGKELNKRRRALEERIAELDVLIGASEDEYRQLVNTSVPATVQQTEQYTVTRLEAGAAYCGTISRNLEIGSGGKVESLLTFLHLDREPASGWTSSRELADALAPKLVSGDRPFWAQLIAGWFRKRATALDARDDDSPAAREARLRSQLLGLVLPSPRDAPRSR